MRRILFALAAVVLTACSPPFIITFPENNDLIFYRADEPSPEWVNKDWWQEGNKIYLVGKAGREVKDLDVRLRIAELDAKGKLFTIKKSCHIFISGALLRRIWQDSNGTIYALVEANADGIVSIESCPNSEIQKKGGD
jgi:hypothetical protein